MRPIWFLDVDGPINAPKAGWGRAATRKHVRVPRLDFSFRLSWEPELVKAVRTIHTNGIAQVVWCTTWCPEADLLENLWGLPELDRAWTEAPDGGYVGDLKLNPVREALKAGRRVIWTDDTETPDKNNNPELYRELMGMGSALLIRPSARRGLRPDDIQRITNFCGEDV